MESYSELAECYDIFMDAVPYEQWLGYIRNMFEKYNIPQGLVLDLGCGTGILTEMLAEAGYDMIGVDLSYDMLCEAMEKRARSGHDILYLCQDMREFELYGTVGAIVSVCDSINYLLDDDDVITTMKLVNNYLDPKGIFVFDFNTVYKYKEIIGDTTIAENRDDYSFIWENYYHDDTHVNEYDVTIFSRVDDLYRKSCETHLQRGYTVEEMQEFASKAGLLFMEATDADTGKEINECTQRVHMVLMEQGK